MEMRLATKNKLGAVIVGEWFNVTAEGVLSVEEQDDYVEFNRERLDEIFEHSKRGNGEQLWKNM